MYFLRDMKGMIFEMIRITKQMKKVFMVLCVISIVCLAFNFNTVKATTTTNDIKTTSNEHSNEQAYTIDLNNEKEVSETIKNFILTVNSEGMNQDFLSQTFELYTQITETYTNDEIVKMIEQNKDELKANNVKMESLDNITKVLKSVETAQLRSVISQIDVDEMATKIRNGANAQELIQEITKKMTTTEKIDFVMTMLSSIHILKTILISILILFVYRTLLRCVIYKKAGKHAWAPFVPIYRNVVMLKICGMSPWWLLLLLIPVVGWVLLFVVSVASKFMLSEAFGKGTIFAFGLWLLAPIFETILVFSRKTKYVGFEIEEECY